MAGSLERLPESPPTLRLPVEAVEGLHYDKKIIEFYWRLNHSGLLGSEWMIVALLLWHDVEVGHWATGLFCSLLHSPPP